jgi:putative FmdB family regulatory protein
LPVYAYACASCDNAFDVRQSFDESALTVCERCGGALRKQYGTIGVSFNGPGFYRNDSRASTEGFPHEHRNHPPGARRPPPGSAHPRRR